MEMDSFDGTYCTQGAHCSIKRGACVPIEEIVKPSANTDSMGVSRESPCMDDGAYVEGLTYSKLPPTTAILPINSEISLELGWGTSFRHQGVSYSI